MNRTHDPQGEAPELEPQLEAAVQSVLSEPVPADAVARVQTRAAALRLLSSNSAALGVQVMDRGDLRSGIVARSETGHSATSET